MTVTTPAGVSRAARIVDQVVLDETRSHQDTATFSNFPLTDQLIDVFNHCSAPGWEGEASRPVEGETLVLAKRLVESLPYCYQTPAIFGEPDGHVCLEWYLTPRRILTVSVDPDGTLYWAAQLGDEDPRGSCHFYGDAPATLLYWIGRVCSK